MRKASEMWAAFEVNQSAATNDTYYIKSFEQEDANYKCIGTVEPSNEKTCSSSGVTIKPGNGTTAWAFLPVAGSSGVYNIISMGGKVCARPH